MKRRNAEYYLSLIILIVVELVVMLPYQQETQQKPIGGKLYAPDFESGFRLYVEEEHCIYNNPYRPEPHSIWTVDDESVKDAVYRLCGDMKSLGTWDPNHTLAGTPGFFWVLPKAYFVTESYGYRIGIYDWRNYRTHVTATWHYYNEMLALSMLSVQRVDLTQKTDDEDTLDYIKNYHYLPDSSNSKAGRGWITTMPRENLTGLLSILNSIDDTVAEVYAAV